MMETSNVTMILNKTISTITTAIIRLSWNKCLFFFPLFYYMCRSRCLKTEVMSRYSRYKFSPPGLLIFTQKQKIIWSTGLSKQKNLWDRLPPHIKSKSLFVKVYIFRVRTRRETSNGCALSFFLSFFLSFLPSRSVVMRVSSSRAGVRPARSNCVSLWTRVERSLPSPPPLSFNLSPVSLVLVILPQTNAVFASSFFRWGRRRGGWRGGWWWRGAPCAPPAFCCWSCSSFF